MERTSFPPRVPWDDGFPDVVIHAPVEAVKGHPDYAAAKAGDHDAAARLVDAMISEDTVAGVAALCLHGTCLVPIHALEPAGVNAIPLALAIDLGRRLGVPVWKSVVQSNLVGHTGASGFSRLARQAAFFGDVASDRSYLLVDDFVGQGGTIANLRGFIGSAGGSVVGCTVLTGKLHSARVTLTSGTLEELRRRHGPDLEQWWKDRFGHAFDCLTESEARYLARTPSADRVRDRIVAEEPDGDG